MRRIAGPLVALLAVIFGWLTLPSIATAGALTPQAIIHRYDAGATSTTSASAHLERGLPATVYDYTALGSVVYTSSCGPLALPQGALAGPHADYDYTARSAQCDSAGGTTRTASGAAEGDVGAVQGASVAANSGKALTRYDPDFALGQLTSGGRASASQLDEFGAVQGWIRSQTATGPVKYTDANGVVRLTIKRGSPRAPGSGGPHVELRNADGYRVDPYGNFVTRRSPGNHTPIDWDW